MIGRGVDPAEVGPLHHHGAELYPVLELIVGPGLPVMGALILARWRTVRRRLPGGPPMRQDTSGPSPEASAAVPEAGRRRGSRPPMI
jgi:hypothetical protein